MNHWLPITSTQNSKLKDAVKLRDRKGRRQQGRFLIDGVVELDRALAGGIEIVEVFATDAHGVAGEDCDRILQTHEVSAACYALPEKVFAKLAYGDRSSGLVATAITPSTQMSQLPMLDNALIVVLEAVEKPGNIGAILRSGDAAGATALIVADPATDLFNPNIVRASRGAIFTTPVCTATADETLQWLRQQDFQILATKVDASRTYADCELTGPTAIVLGSESDGLSDVWSSADQSVTPVTIPMQGTIDSLNVSVSAAVMLFEAQRQRRSAE